MMKTAGKKVKLIPIISQQLKQILDINSQIQRSEMDEKNKKKKKNLWITPPLATGSCTALKGLRKHQGSMAL